MGYGMSVSPYPAKMVRDLAVSRRMKCCNANLHVMFVEGVGEVMVERVGNQYVLWKDPRHHPAIRNRRNLAITIARWIMEFPRGVVCYKHCTPKLQKMTSEMNGEEWIIPVKAHKFAVQPFLAEIRSRYSYPVNKEINMSRWQRDYENPYEMWVESNDP